MTRQIVRAILTIILLAIVLACGGIPRPASSATPPSPLAPSSTLLAPLPSPSAPRSTPLAFPRLGMWWPNPWEQPLADIARYDWVILGPWSAEFIDPLKALHPDIRLLTSTNACELDYDPDDPAYNAYLQDIPYQWYLTQVGSQLSIDVDASTTTFHVDAVTVTGGDGAAYDLFIPGDTALIEGESVLIEAVNPTLRTLTVQRGYVRPAAAHAAGTRIAAHVTFWPNSWVMNVSTLSPQGVISATVGEEIWPEYNARLAAGLLADPRWDGILLDRSDPNESWLIGNSTARTIDPDQSNTLLTDYSAFDAAWNEGLRLYEQNLRLAVGNSRIIFVNWGMTNYDLLNGNNFEGFPMDNATAYGENWRSAVFGPWPEKGSYFDWLAYARQPNLTMIETYEDDRGPDPTSGGGYDNPCDDPGFTPNYRKMRFGLTTALLGDGYFSYEINTNGHGSLCLLWFDEYDNAGQGRGYLGVPLGPAVRAVTALTTPNLLPSGGFESQADLDQWDFWADTDQGYSATLRLDTTTSAVGDASARMDILQTQGTDWQVSLSFEPVTVISGTDYTLSFWARADITRTVSAWGQQNHDPWEGWLVYGEFTLTPEWRQYEVAATATGSDAQSVFQFGLGQTTGVVWLDGVQLQTGSREVWRRDFTNGVALVNASAQPQVIELGGTYRKINGTQDTAVNNGSQVSQVTLPPHDGLIILRWQPQSWIYLPVVSIPPANRRGR